MKTKDLRISNVVLYGDKARIIQSEDLLYLDFTLVKSVMLSLEVFTDNGFTAYGKYLLRRFEDKEIYVRDMNGTAFYIYINKPKETGDYISVECHLHSLQNLIFCLTRQEFEVDMERLPIKKSLLLHQRD